MNASSRTMSRRSILRAGGLILGTSALLGANGFSGVAWAGIRRVSLRSVINGRYVTARNSYLKADAASVGPAQLFDTIDLGGGIVALRSVALGQVVCAESGGATQLTADRDAAGSWESFRLVDQGDGSVAIFANANQRWVCAESAGDGWLIPNRDRVGRWERFVMATAEISDSANNSDRSTLVPGTYRPGPSTTGPVAGTNLQTINGDLKATYDGQVIENVEVWGSIDLGKFSSVRIRNSVIHGTTAVGILTACIFGSGDNLRGALIEDCRLEGQGTPWCAGIRGGNFTVRRTEMKNLPDGISLTSQLGNVTAEACWIHDGLYMEWLPGTPNMPNASNSYTHTDGVQFHRGSNYVIRGNMIGGTRVPGKVRTGLAAAISGGDDMYNAAIMINQEVDNTAANRITNVLIEKNWLAGGQSTINITNNRDNNFETTVIRNNRFVRSTWGTQYYILRTGSVGVFENNVFDDDGSAVPISRGA